MASQREFRLPDIGDFENVDVVEVLVSAGDRVAKDDSLVVLESDKATMEIPSPVDGTVVEIRVSVGDQVSEGDLVAILEAAEEKEEAPPADAARARGGPADAEPQTDTEPEAARASRDEGGREPSAGATGQEEADEAHGEEVEGTAAPAARPEADAARPARPASQAPRARDPREAAAPPPVRAHASPSVRRLARELGVELEHVPGSGRKGRILKDDVQAYVKAALGQGRAGGVPLAGVHVAAAPEIDFSKFGETELVPLNRIRRLSAANLHRSWVTVPHVTQFDEADITGLEAFRKERRAEAEDRGFKLTFLPFLVKACTAALAEFPHFNASLDPTGESLVVKRYFHIGVAVETENGLVVPVIRDAERKGLFALAAELQDLSERARKRRLGPAELQGGSFSISSLGGIGGTFFTPIVNHPEVAILGVSRMEWKPVWREDAFVPRLILPLSLSYDHRVIDGADAVRFTGRVSAFLSDLRLLLV